MNNTEIKKNSVVHPRTASYPAVSPSIREKICDFSLETSNDSRKDYFVTSEYDESTLSEFERARRSSKTWSMGQD